MSAEDSSKERSSITEISGSVSGTKWMVYPETVLLSSNPTTLYKSPDTGLRGIAIKTGEPLCSLHVAIATEAYTNSYAHKDDGLPHTLEHAIFLGSDQYPYKGILDKLANRCLASGTNAWTATDHTAYTLTTAGEEGALNLLPIYADHILFPTLSDESFVTEVHHITPEGNDKGVVYCEMQGRENSYGSLVDRALMDLLYPSDRCGYSSETGGKMKNLRTLQNHQVRRYHREYYTPDNTLFILSGNIENQDFLQALDKVENNIKSREKNTQTKSRIQYRPWTTEQSIVPPLDLDRLGVMPPYNTDPKRYEPRTIKFPSEEESRGTITIGWRGPEYHERELWVQLKLLWEYLTDSAASPLEKAFVECAEPVCAGLYPTREIFTQGYQQLWFVEVNVAKMEDVIPKLFQTLIEAMDDNNLDLDRMHMVIRRYRRQVLEYSEKRPTNMLVDGIIRNFLYSSRGGDGEEKKEDGPQEEMQHLKDDADTLSMMEDAIGLSKQDWQQLCTKYLLERPYCVVVGKPSAELAKSMADQEKKREEQQAKDLGNEKLKELGKTLESAIEFNEREIPPEILTSVPIPSIDKVKQVPVLTIRGSGGNILAEGEKGESPGMLRIATNSGRGIPKEECDAILSKLQKNANEAKDPTNGIPIASPYYVNWNHFESAFLSVGIGLDTKSLTAQQRLYLPLLLELAFKLPATLDDGTTTLSKDEFVSQLQNDTVSYGAFQGCMGGRIPQMVSFKVQLENPKEGTGLEHAMKWIRRVLYNTTLSVEDVRMTIQKLLSEIPTQLRDGPTICRAVSAEFNYCSQLSNKVAATTLRQWPFLEQLLKQMEENDGSGGTKIVQEIETIRKELIQTRNMQLFVAGDLSRISKPMEILANALLPPNHKDHSEFLLSLRQQEQQNDTGVGKPITNVSAWSVCSDATGQGAVCPLSAIESSFLSITCNTGVGSYDTNHASILVAIEYLTALEGPFWVKLRGAGLTYSSSMYNVTETKKIVFSLFKCTDPIGAFNAAKQILLGYTAADDDNRSQILDVDIENSKSSLAYSLIAGTSTRLAAAIDSWVSSYDNKEVDYNQWLLSQIKNVTAKDILRAMKTHLVPIFDSRHSNLVVTCPTNKAEEIGKYFSTAAGWGDQLQIVPEDKLCTTTFLKNQDDKNIANETTTTKKLPQDVLDNVSMFMPGAFASQFKCACPRCG